MTNTTTDTNHNSTPNPNPPTQNCICRFHNYTVAGLSNGVIRVSNGTTTFHIAGNLVEHGLRQNQITNIIVRGEPGEQEIVLSDGNNELILDAEITFGRFRDLQ